jgi:hypothetical protein
MYCKGFWWIFATYSKGRQVLQKTFGE